MSLRTVRIGAGVVYLLALAALTWPVLTRVNQVEPQILGLPFHMAWFAGWIVVTFVTLLIVDRFETAAEEEDRS